MRLVLTTAIGIAALALAAQAAGAADIPARAPVAKGPVVAPAPIHNWTGVYVGGHVGYGWGDKGWAEPGSPIALEYGVDGFLAGGQIGANYQSGPWVWGLEADISWTNVKGDIFVSFCGISCTTDMNWLATVTGRIGYASGPGLFYVKGGAAWADEDHVALAPFPFRGSETRSGWTLGAGYEYDFGNNWSARLEYNYIDFGKEAVRLVPPAPFPADLLDIDQDLHVVKFGLNYRFATGKAPLGKAPAPVVTKY